MRAFEMGWQAAECGAMLRDNPFHRISGAAIAWRAGFRAFWQSLNRQED